MPWSGSFVFGNTYAAYFGPSDENSFHHHAAIQIVLSKENRVSIVDGEGKEFVGSCHLIKPLVTHSVKCGDPLSLVYLDPHSALGLELMSQAGKEDITILKESILPFDASSNPQEVINILKEVSGALSANIDERLTQALSELAASPGSTTIKEVARRCDLSESRLRSIARKQFGVPLSTWLLWRKLEKSARELAKGATLSDAALAGGFADQAHFSRAMRRMFGVTPAVAASSLRT